MAEEEIINQGFSPLRTAVASQPLPSAALAAHSKLNKCFLGHCFRCLAKDHLVAHCRELVKCLLCYAFGHCPSCRRRPHPPPTASTQHSPSSHPVLPVLHRHFSPRQAAMSYRLGHPSNRPPRVKTVVVIKGEMKADLFDLQDTAVCITVSGSPDPDTKNWVGIPFGEMQVTHHNPNTVTHTTIGLTSP